MKLRQVAPDISGIRDDHVNRYQFAVDEFMAAGATGQILDIGCGVGYGSKLMADICDVDVLGIDICGETIDYACEHYHSDNMKTMFLWLDMSEIDLGLFTVLTMFEVIEHSDQAPAFLAEASKTCKYLFGSVPNENVVPFNDGNYNTEHYRHYTPEEIREELEQAGWSVKKMGSQIKKQGDGSKINFNNLKGRTIVFMAESKYA